MSILDDILKREVTRREFLKTIGLSIISIMGLSTIIGILSGKNENNSSNPGFGSGLYGGDELLKKKTDSKSDYI